MKHGIDRRAFFKGIAATSALIGSGVPILAAASNPLFAYTVVIGDEGSSVVEFASSVEDAWRQVVMSQWGTSVVCVMSLRWRSPFFREQ